MTTVAAAEDVGLSVAQLRALKDALGLNQEQLGKAIGVSQGNISAILRTDAAPSRAAAWPGKAAAWQRQVQRLAQLPTSDLEHLGVVTTTSAGPRSSGAAAEEGRAADIIAESAELRTQLAEQEQAGCCGGDCCGGCCGGGG